MLIYTGNSSGRALEEVKRLGMGIMICTTPSGSVDKEWKGLPLALDNGAFSCWNRGLPFMSDVFRNQIVAVHKNGLSLNFMVCPDLIGRGKKSLDFSMKWARGELLSCGRLALAVQDGMTPAMVDERNPEEYFNTIFVGGTKEWKWNNAGDWVEYAHSKGLKCHIGRCGTLDKMLYAHDIGADSVDSTNFTRNKTWNVVEDFEKIVGLRGTMFD